jgi:gluconolactonase
MKSKAMFATVLILSQAGFAQEQGRGKKQGLGQPEGVRQVTVTEIPGVVAAGAKWTLAWQGTDNADGIVGTTDGGLLFAQEQPNRISKLDKNDKVSVFLEDTHGAGALTIDSHGRILAAERTCTDPGRQPAQCSEPTAVGVLAPERKILGDNIGGKSLGRLNDLTVDKKGNVYFNGSGTFHLNAKGQVSSIGENIRTNGIILSRDEKTLYVTNGGALVAFDIQPNGRVGNQRDFGKLEAGGNGDGMAIDAEGRLYVTSGPAFRCSARKESTWASFRRRGV